MPTSGFRNRSLAGRRRADRLSGAGAPILPRWASGHEGSTFKASAAKLKADKAARLEAELVVDRWNRRLATGRDMLWSPTIRAALVAVTPWLDVFCPGCGTSRAIDLRTVDRHPLASVGTLVLGLRCSWCPGSAPMPKLLGLHALPPANRQGVAL
jgi:hypothetical protein